MTAERAREVLAEAIRAQGDSAQSADGIEAGRDHAVWAHVALRAMEILAAEREAAAIEAAAKVAEAAFQVAMRGGELIIAADGLEQLRPSPQALLDALKTYRDERAAAIRQLAPTQGDK